MHHFYVIQSKETRELYYGYTSNLSQRLENHNSEATTSTRDGAPWVLIYCESYRSKDDAQDREQQIKQYGNARTYLKDRIQDSLLT